MSEIIVTGLAASLGEAIGTVVLMDDILENNKFDFEEVVVVGEMVPPEVTLLPNNTRAIVTDEGGVLCHGATLARELGIPCVVGTGNATQILKPGMKVKVDGGNGLVYFER